MFCCWHYGDVVESLFKIYCEKLGIILTKLGPRIYHDTYKTFCWKLCILAAHINRLVSNIQDVPIIQ